MTKDRISGCMSLRVLGLDAAAKTRPAKRAGSRACLEPRQALVATGRRPRPTRPTACHPRLLWTGHICRPSASICHLWCASSYISAAPCLLTLALYAVKSLQGFLAVLNRAMAVLAVANCETVTLETRDTGHGLHRPPLPWWVAREFRKSSCIPARWRLSAVVFTLPVLMSDPRFFLLSAEPAARATQDERSRSPPRFP